MRVYCADLLGLKGRPGVRLEAYGIRGVYSHFKLSFQMVEFVTGFTDDERQLSPKSKFLSLLVPFTYPGFAVKTDMAHNKIT